MAVDDEKIHLQLVLFTFVFSVMAVRVRLEMSVV